MLSLALRQADDTFRWLIQARHMDGLIVASALAEDTFVRACKTSTSRLC